MECLSGKSSECIKYTVVYFCNPSLVAKLTRYIYIYTIGPIIRITPHELHVKDAHFYDEIYAASTRKTEKYPNFVAHFGAPSSMVTTIDHDHHRLRRAPLNSFFSKRSVVRLEPVIRENIDKLFNRFDGDRTAQSVIRLDVAFIALTTDIITHYSYGHSYNYLDEPDYKLEWKEGVLEASANGATMRHFPVVLAVSKNMPRWLLKKLNSRIAILLEIQDMVRNQSLESLRNSKKENNTAEAKSIFDALNDPTLLAPEERTIDRLQDEGQILLGAGSETTAKTLTVIAFHLLQSPDLLEKLREELRTAMPKPTSTASWNELELLPFLVCHQSILFTHSLELTKNRQP
jgi:cytochrome P450